MNTREEKYILCMSLITNQEWMFMDSFAEIIRLQLNDSYLHKRCCFPSAFTCKVNLNRVNNLIMLNSNWHMVIYDRIYTDNVRVGSKRPIEPIAIAITYWYYRLRTDFFRLLPALIIVYFLRLVCRIHLLSSSRCAYTNRWPAR